MSGKFWKEIHAEAWRRIREHGLLDWKRLATSIGIPIGQGVVQWKAGVSLPINIVVTIGTGLCLYTLLVFAERYIRTREVIQERDETHRKTISEKDRRIEELTRPSSRAYSEAELAQLARLRREGNELYKETISVNAPSPTLALDRWFNKHNTWREHVLSILRDRDAAIFEGPITAGSQTIGHQGALNRVHGDRRGQLLEELARIDKVLERNAN